MYVFFHQREQIIQNLCFFLIVLSLSHLGRASYSTNMATVRLFTFYLKINQIASYSNHFVSNEKSFEQKFEIFVQVCYSRRIMN